MSNSAGMPGSRSWKGVGVLMAVAFLVPLGWLGVDRLKVDFAERAAVPSGLATSASSTDRLLVGWKNATLEDVRVPLLQDRLLGGKGEDGVRRGGSPYVASATTPLDRLQQMIDQGISPDVAFHSLTGSIIGSGKLRVTLTAEGRLAKESTIQAIENQGRSQLSLDLRVSPRTIPFFPEEGDKLFEAVAIKIPSGIPSDLPGEHDLELSWDGIHNPESGRNVQKLLGTLVGYPTADFPAGVPLIASAERHAGMPVALEVCLSAAGLIDPAAALEDIRQRASSCRVPSGDMLFLGAAVPAAAQHQGMLSVLSAPIEQRAIPAAATIPAAAFAVLVGVLLLGVRSLRRVLVSLCLVAVVTLITVGGFGLAGIPFDVPAAGGVLAGMAVSLSLLISASAPSADAASHRRGARSAAIILLAATTVMMGVPSPSLRVAAIALAGMTALTFALIEANLLSVALSAPHEGAVNDEWTFLLTGPGRWIGRGGLLLAVIAAAGLWFAKPSFELGRQLAENHVLSGQIREANDTLAGSNLLETTIRFDRSAQDRLRFLERMELIRHIESDLKNVPGVTGAFSAADLQPSRILQENASSRERIAFNRLSRTVEDKVRSETTAERASLVSFTTAAPAGERSDERWTIRLQADSTANLEGLLKQVGTVIPQRIRVEPGVHHEVSGAPLARATHIRQIRLSLIIMLAASFAVATVVVALLLKDMLAVLAVILPNVLVQGAVLGVFALLGNPVTLLSILSAHVAGLLALSVSTRTVSSAQQRVRRNQDATTALAATLAESCRGVVSLMASFAAAALTVGMLSPTFLGEAAYVVAAGLLTGLMAALVIVPSLTVGRLERDARSSEDADQWANLQPPARQSPLRRSA